MDFSKIASQVATVNVEAARKQKKKKKGRSVVEAPTEFAVRMDLSIAVNFEGETLKPALLKKLQSEIKAMVESAVKITARDLKLKPSDISIRPNDVECIVTSGDDPDFSNDHDYDD